MGSILYTERIQLSGTFMTKRKQDWYGVNQAGHVFPTADRIDLLFLDLIDIGRLAYPEIKITLLFPELDTERLNEENMLAGIIPNDSSSDR